MALESFVNGASELANSVGKSIDNISRNFDSRKNNENFVLNDQTKEDKPIRYEEIDGKGKTKEKNIDIDKRKKPNVEHLQKKHINEAESKIGVDKLDPQGRGNYAEMKVDRDLADKGYKRISKECVTDLKTPTGQGIDGVYQNKKTGETLIVETKCNKSDLGKTLDGKQMCSQWIDNRLDAAVGKEQADSIRMNSIVNPDSVKSVLARVDLDGKISYSRLDGNANNIGGLHI